MWLFTRYGLFSVTCSRQNQGKGPVDPNTLQIRARVRGHLENLMMAFPELIGHATIHEWGGDYPVRLLVPKQTWQAVAVALAQDIDYDNFKDECHDHASSLGDDYISSLFTVWQIGKKFQSSKRAPKQTTARRPVHVDDLSRCASALYNTPWGQRTTVDYRGFVEPLRLFLVPWTRWPNSEQYGALYECAGELDLAGTLHLGADLALALLLRNRAEVPEFADLRRALLVMRQFADQRCACRTVLDVVMKTLTLLKPPKSDQIPDGLFIAYRAAYRALFIAAIAAAFEAGELEIRRELEAMAPSPYNVDFIADGGDESGTLFVLIRRRLAQIGRRAIPADYGWMAELARQRCQYRALELIARDTQKPCSEVCVAKHDALVYMNEHIITPAIRPDGAGQFVLELGAEVVRNGTADHRVIEGYGFSDDGEAVYVVRKPEDGKLTTKRCWKAMQDYSATGEWLNLDLVPKPKGSVAWRNIPAC